MDSLKLCQIYGLQLLNMVDNSFRQPEEEPLDGQRFSWRQWLARSLLLQTPERNMDRPATYSRMRSCTGDLEYENLTVKVKTSPNLQPKSKR